MITAIVLTKNEEKNIIDCLEGLTFCNEIIIIDDYSIDRTEEIVRNLGNSKIKFIKNRLENNFSRQRNLGLGMAKNEWILFVDADERIGESLKTEINDNLRNQNINGYYIRRIDSIWGKELKHGETGDVSFIRLGRKGKGEWEGRVHEVWQIEGSKRHLVHPMMHFPHPKLSEFLSEVNFYTSLRADELKEKGIRVRTLDILLYPLGKFLNNYFLKLGILDGIQGFIFSIVMSFHSFLVRSKLWLRLR